MEKTTAPATPELLEEVWDTLADKAGLPMRAMVVLGVLAGVFIGLGGLFAIVVLAGAENMPYGVAQLLAGLVFSVGLVLVMVAGAELFTGNLMMAGPVASGRLPAGRALAALAIVYCANFAGSLLLAGLVLGAGVHTGHGGAVGQAALDLAASKSDKSFAVTLVSGILANILVCLAVWMAYAGRTVTQKIFGLLLPVTAFVAAGLEHSIANMYLLPYAFLVQEATGNAGAALSVPAILANLIPATIGNVIGGACVALAYWQAVGKRA